MALKSMKMSAEEAREVGLASDPSDAPQYPYGLLLSLNDETMTQLGMSEMPAVGSKVMITAMATVMSTNASSTQSGETEKCVGLQITDMDIKPGEGKSAADTLYGSGE
jgi:hypothetical protein